MTAPTTHWSTTGRLHTGTVAGCGACGVAGIMPAADFRLLEHRCGSAPLPSIPAATLAPVAEPTERCLF